MWRIDDGRTTRIGNVKLPPIDQVGYVVKSLDVTDALSVDHSMGRALADGALDTVVNNAA